MSRSSVHGIIPESLPHIGSSVTTSMLGLLKRPAPPTPHSPKVFGAWNVPAASMTSFRALAIRMEPCHGDFDSYCTKSQYLFVG